MLTEKVYQNLLRSKGYLLWRGERGGSGRGR